MNYIKARYLAEGLPLKGIEKKEDIGISIKNIKNKTYSNFMMVVRAIMKKGYAQDEAISMTHRFFDELNPLGESMQIKVDRIMRKTDWESLYENER